VKSPKSQKRLQPSPKSSSPTRVVRVQTQEPLEKINEEIEKDRHLYRILQQILVEVRANRQYTQFLHTLMSRSDIGKQVKLESPDEIKKKMKARRAEISRINQQKREDERTPLSQEEREAFERGEDPPGTSYEEA